MISPRDHRDQPTKDDDGEATPTEASSHTTPATVSPFARPPLLRSLPGPTSGLTEIQTSTPTNPTTSDSKLAIVESDNVQNDVAGQQGLRLVQGQGFIKEDSPAKAKSKGDGQSAQKIRGWNALSTRSTFGSSKRVSPIREEDVGAILPMPASIMSSLGDPMRTASTVSTESNDSQRTIRVSVPTTPIVNPALRTPSYPFPYVPGTPKAWSQKFHQPFTSLSPTVHAPALGDQDTPGKSPAIASGASTPGPQAPFLPPGETPAAGSQDPRYPTPNLYELVLKLNSEPGLEQWWATLTNILCDDFKAERASLIVPIDPTDIENVPWGQKAVLDINGHQDRANALHPPGRPSCAESFDIRPPEHVQRDPLTTQSRELGPQKLHPERLRPRLEARHSYAGHGREVRSVLSTLNDPSLKQNSRPLGPRRMNTHTSTFESLSQSVRYDVGRSDPTVAVQHTPLSDPDFSSVGGPPDEPLAKVFNTFRVLDHEDEPLIEPAGITRVLERGRVVTVTRDHLPKSSLEAAAQNVTEDAHPLKFNKAFEESRHPFVSNEQQKRRGYDEYEQHPSSPWTQSPAPSPAIQSDESINPFFSPDEQQVEDSFNPSISPRDYAEIAQVEAIGVDHASTVIHVPLIHPTLSQPMQALRTPPTRNKGFEMPGTQNVDDLQRKAPIAILSILSSTIPYPQNLLQTLKYLGPHMATSFSIAQQFSSSHAQTVGTRLRRTTSDQNSISTPMKLEPTTLEESLQFDLRERSGSITSPSDYSGRSRYSPSGSIIGTPGWDPAAHGWLSSRSGSGTPALSGSEGVDNYFESKKRSGQKPKNLSTNHNQSNLASKGSPTGESKSKSRNGDDDNRSIWSERSPGLPKEEKEDKTAQKQGNRAASVPRTVDGGVLHPGANREVPPQGIQPNAKSHTLLHSYGANSTYSFGLLPENETMIERETPGAFGHLRKNSFSADMPPPSERLLRTIIDSVPVQIFTAQPETGRLSWVNSKFLIYRGQEPRQILDDPWQAIHAHDREEFLNAWHRSLRTKQQLQRKVRLQRFDGSYRWFYVRAAPLKDTKQKVVHWIGTMMDFHEQHLAELNSARQQETAASEAKYRALANSSPQIVFAVKRANGVAFCNTQWLHYSGQTESQALGLGFMDHVHPDDIVKCKLPTFEDHSSQPTNVPTTMPLELHRTKSASSSDATGNTDSNSSPVAPMPQRKLSELADTGILKITRDADGRPSYSTEVRLKSKDNEYRWHLVRVLLAEPASGNNIEEETWYGTCTDINDHKTLERDLKETMDEKSRFLSNMSHEIRTPLNGITGMVNFLIDSSLTAEQMEHVNIIRASTEGLRGLINDILDLSKAEAGMIQLNSDWLHVRALIEEVNDLTSAMAIDKGLELNYLVDEDVPPQIKGDRFRIRQILLNIVGNAIKFTLQGEVFVRCCLKDDDEKVLTRDEMFIKFEVIDTGMGFTDKEAEHLFKRFSQIDGSSTRQHGGSGLGLVISQQLAQLHGGDMSAKGAPGKGSTFTFFIKTTLPSEKDQPLPAASAAAVTTIPILPVAEDITASPSPLTTPTHTPARVATSNSLTQTTSNPVTSSPLATMTTTHEIENQQPSTLASSREQDTKSPSVSSVSSIPSLESTVQSSGVRSEGSSISSFQSDSAGAANQMPMPSSSLPVTRQSGSSDSTPTASKKLHRKDSIEEVHRFDSPHQVPPVYSILVAAPLKYSRCATVQHISKTLPRDEPHQVIELENLSQCQTLLAGKDAFKFTHVVLVLQQVDEIIRIMEQVLGSKNPATSIVLITDLAQRRKIMEQAPNFNYTRLVNERKLHFVFKPLKPSRLGLIFDPQKEREMSTDHNQDSAQQVAVNQKQVFDELTQRLGNRDKRVLLVEDNKINQMVILKFLAKVSIQVEVVVDGVQCTNKVFSKPHGYYSIILCDLHMPNKDGYQTCKEVRKWEKRNQSSHLPIIALSANVLGDVYQQCVDAGFNSYMTKPVDFKELSSVLMMFMDPSDPSKPHELLRRKIAAAPSQSHEAKT